MPDVVLHAERRPLTGSRPSSRLRRQGRVPAIMYGHGEKPVAVAVDARELRLALSTDAGVNALLSLSVGGTDHLAMARELQRDPIKRNVVHVDLHIVGRDEVVQASVPLSLVGQPVKVERAGGALSQDLFALDVRATPRLIPSSIEVDVADLVIGDVVRVGDIQLPEGVAVDQDADGVIVSASVTRAAVAEAAVGEGAGGEGAEAAPSGAGGAGGAAGPRG